MNNSIDYFKTMQGSVEIGISGKRLYTVFYIDRINGQYKELVYDLTDTVPMLNYEKTQYIYPYSYYCRNSDNKEVEWMFNNKEKEDIYTLLSNLNPSQNDFWDAIIKKK